MLDQHPITEMAKTASTLDNVKTFIGSFDSYNFHMIWQMWFDLTY